MKIRHLILSLILFVSCEKKKELTPAEKEAAEVCELQSKADSIGKLYDSLHLLKDLDAYNTYSGLADSKIRHFYEQRTKDTASFNQFSRYLDECRAGKSKR